MLSHGFVSDVWKDIFEFNGVENFTTLWRITQENATVLAPTPLDLRLPHGGRTRVLIKHQDQSGQNRLLALFKKSALANEVRHLLMLKKNHIITTEPVYFYTTPEQRTLLIVCDLTHFTSLRQLHAQWQHNQPSFQMRMAITAQMGKIIRQLHQLKRIHGQLGDEYIWVRCSMPEGKRKLEDRVIGLTDVRRAKRFQMKSRAIMTDLGHLLAVGTHWSKTNQLRFFLRYREHTTLSSADKRLIRRILKRIQPHNHTSRISKLFRGWQFTFNHHPHRVSID
jgi:hypothetical protein